jgi:50S ribosomal subunit-associated GTPase HflX
VFNKLDAIEPGQRPAALQDAMDSPAAGAAVFVSARSGEGLGPLREELARRVQAAVQARKTGPEGGAHAIGHNGWMKTAEKSTNEATFQRLRPAGCRAASGACST